MNNGQTTYFNMDIMTKTEREVGNPLKPKFYKRFVDDIINRRKNQPDQLFENFNNYITYIACITSIVQLRYALKSSWIRNGFMKRNQSQPKYITIKEIYQFIGHHKILKQRKRNVITSGLDRPAGMARVPGHEIPGIDYKFINAGCPLRFINSVIKQFSRKSSEMDDFIIPHRLFDIPKKVVLVEIPYCPKNEASSMRFIKNFDELTNSLYDPRIKWVTKKVKQLFKF